MARFTRFVLYTFFWCLFPPLFFIKNRGYMAGYAFLPRGAAKRIGKLLKRGNLLAAVELFWSGWNPGVTYETTRPLYQFCGGNRHPLFATSVCFLYSGVFLHWGGLRNNVVSNHGDAPQGTCRSDRPLGHWALCFRGFTRAHK